MTDGSALAPLRIAAMALLLSCGLVLATLAADPETMRLAVVTPPPTPPGELSTATMIAARPTLPPPPARPSAENRATGEHVAEDRDSKSRPPVRLATTSMDGLKLHAHGPRPAPRRVPAGGAKPDLPSRRVPDPLDWADLDAFDPPPAGAPQTVEPAREVADVALLEASPLPTTEPATTERPAAGGKILRGFYSEETVTRDAGDGVGFFGSWPLIGSLPVAADEPPQTLHRRRTLLLLPADEATRMFEDHLRGQSAEPPSRPSL